MAPADSAASAIETAQIANLLESPRPAMAPSQLTRKKQLQQKSSAWTSPRAKYPAREAASFANIACVTDCDARNLKLLGKSAAGDQSERRRRADAAARRRPVDRRRGALALPRAQCDNRRLSPTRALGLGSD
jgi:hypothetical protein